MRANSTISDGPGTELEEKPPTPMRPRTMSLSDAARARASSWAGAAYDSAMQVYDSASEAARPIQDVASKQQESFLARSAIAFAEVKSNAIRRVDETINNHEKYRPLAALQLQKAIQEFLSLCGEPPRASLEPEELARLLVMRGLQLVKRAEQAEDAVAARERDVEDECDRADAAEKALAAREKELAQARERIRTLEAALPAMPPNGNGAVIDEGSVAAC